MDPSTWLRITSVKEGCLVEDIRTHVEQGKHSKARGRSGAGGPELTVRAQMGEKGLHRLIIQSMGVQVSERCRGNKDLDGVRRAYLRRGK